MGKPTATHLFEANHQGVDSPDDPNLFSMAEMGCTPVVADSAARDALYPTPVGDEKVIEKDTGKGKRYNLASLSWVIDPVGDFAFVVRPTVVNGATDNRAAIQAQLDAANAAGGGDVFVPPFGNNVYGISASLVIYSNTTLRLAEIVTIKLLPGSNTNMIHNAAWVAGSGRDSNIKILGGTWDRQANVGAGNPSQTPHAMLFQRVDGLTIDSLTGNGTAGKYHILIYACTKFIVNNITFSVFSDGVHVSGASSKGKITNIYGTTGDDCVALTPVDYSQYLNGDLGDITDVEVNGVYATATNSANGCKVIVGSNAGTNYNCRRITIKNISGSFGDNAVYLGGDSSQAGTQGGSLYDIEGDQVANSNGNGVGIRNIGTGVLDGVTLSHINSSPTALKTAINLDATGSAVTVGLMTVRDCVWNQTTGAAPISVQSGAVIQTLIVEDSTFAQPGTVYGITIQGTASTINTLRVKGCRLKVQTASAGLISTLSGLSQVLGDVFIEDFVAEQCAHALGDFYTTTNFYIRGLKAGTISTLMFLRATAVIDIKAASGLVGTNANTIGNGGAYSLTSRALEFRVDSALLAKNNGDMCYNTNVASGGVGPSVCDGTNWNQIDDSKFLTANAANWVKGQSSELLTLSTSGTTTDTSANLLPVDSIIEAVVARVTTTITTATDWKLGDATIAGRFSPVNSTMTAGTTQVGTVHADQTGTSGPRQTAAAKVRVTTTGTPGAGAIRITVFYRQFVAPTS